MVKPRAGKAGEGVDHAADTGRVVEHDQRVNRVVIHLLSGLHNLGGAGDGLGIAGHDLTNRRRKERLSQTLHGATDIAICDDTH